MSEEEEESRTSPVGLYHYALSYRVAADRLAKMSRARATHPDAPREFLYIHSIELYLKALLRLKGYSLKTLKGFSHRMDKLAKAFEYEGGKLSKQDKALLSMLDWDYVMCLRYIVTGARTVPPLKAYAATSKRLHAVVRNALRAAGQVCSE